MELTKEELIIELEESLVEVLLELSDEEVDDWHRDTLEMMAIEIERDLERLKGE